MQTFYLTSGTSDRTGDLIISESEAFAMLALNRNTRDVDQADTARAHDGEVWVWEDPFAADVNDIERYRWSESRPDAVAERRERADDI